jgi:hypothetical protein
MYEYSDKSNQLSSLTFTKAELTYLLFVLMKDVPITNTSTSIEMIELRHYLNQIHKEITHSTFNGELYKAVVESFNATSTKPIKNTATIPSSKTDTNTRTHSLPSLEALKQQFPTLSEQEIQEVLENARKEQQKKAEEEQKKNPTFSPPPIKFLTAIGETESAHNVQVQGTSVNLNPSTENSQRFASLLGEV